MGNLLNFPERFQKPSQKEETSEIAEGITITRAEAEKINSLFVKISKFSNRLFWEKNAYETVKGLDLGQLIKLCLEVTDEQLAIKPYFYNLIMHRIVVDFPSSYNKIINLVLSSS